MNLKFKDLPSIVSLDNIDRVRIWTDTEDRVCVGPYNALCARYGEIDVIFPVRVEREYDALTLNVYLDFEVY